MSLDQIRKAQLDKLGKLRNWNINPYPAKSWRDHTIAEILAKFKEYAKEKERVVLAGRIIAHRKHGGSMFLDIDDGSGRMQVYLKKDVLGKQEYKIFEELIGIGDFIELHGFLFLTHKQEKTLEAERYRILAKAVLPLPEKWHGLQDVEERFRKRYLDVMLNSPVKQKLLFRSKIIAAVRDFFVKEGFIEVETPMLQVLAGGATAKPFTTHLDTLDLDLYLRVAPELYLKRLLITGIEKVFEIGRNFRNEGIDRDHNPEFTMLEAYAAYHDYEWMMNFIQRLMSRIGKDLKEDLATGQWDFSKPFERIKFVDVLKQYAGIDWEISDEHDFRAKAQQLDLEVRKAMTKENLADEIFKKVIRPKLEQPTFVIDHPLELSPLAKKKADNSAYVERFQLIINGMELANAFSELNDPQDQLERFLAQEEKRVKGDEEAQHLDKDFIEALEYGMPPAAGIGIGIDRLVALLTNSKSLREVLWFPLMKPR